MENLKNIIPDNKILKQLIESSNVNLLSAGSITPDKGHKFFIEIVRDYSLNYGFDVCLNIIGKIHKDFVDYIGELNALANEYGLKERVKIFDIWDEPSILAYYLGSNFFLYYSEKEDFAPEVLKAQYLYLPVILKKSPRIEYTSGKDQIILSDDVKEYSAAIRILSREERYTQFLIVRGLENYKNRFSDKAFTGETI